MINISVIAVIVYFSLAFINVLCIYT